MRITSIVGLSLVAGCTGTIGGGSSGAVFNSDAIAKFSMSDGAFVQGHALGVLYMHDTVPQHTQNTGFTYQPGLSAPNAKVGYDWNAVIASGATSASVGSGSGACNEGLGGCGSGSGSGSGSDSGSGSGDGACETFLQPAADDAKAMIAKIDLEAVMTDAYAGQTATYAARFQAGVAEALASEDQADKDPGVEMGPVRDQAISDGLCSHSPLVLDLDGTGIEASAIGDGVRFDLLATGRPVATAWPSRGALLVLDRDGDGRITSGKELFGNGSGAGNGFAELARFDADGNGRIDRADPVFAQLRLWRDANHDGTSQPDELQTLAQAGVTAISLAYDTSDARDRFGNPLHETGTFVRANGATGSVVDVWFRYLPAR